MRAGRIAAVDRDGLWPLTGRKSPTLLADPECLTTAFTQEVGEDNDPCAAKSGAYYAIKVDRRAHAEARSSSAAGAGKGRRAVASLDGG